MTTETNEKPQEEIVVQIEEDEDKAFDAGFDPKKAEEADKSEAGKKAAEDAEKAEAEKKAAEDAAKAEADKAKPDPEDAPVTLTKRQFELLMGSHEKAAKLQETVDRLAGTLGATRQEIETLKKSETKITDADVESELRAMVEQFPEMGAAVKGGLKALFKKTIGRAPTTGMSEEQMQKRIVDTVNKREIEAMDDAYPDWREIVKPGADGKATPYRAWLATKSEAYQRRINGTEVASVLTRAIDLFHKDKEAADKKAAEDASKAAADKAKAGDGKGGASAHAARLRAAIPPKGDGRGDPKPKTETEDEAFDSGYKDNRPRVTH